MRQRPALTLAVITVLLAGLLVPAGSAFGSTERRKNKVDSAIDDLRHDLNETSRELRAAARALQRAESRLPSAQAKVARVHGKLVAAQARDRVLAGQLDVARAEVSRAKKEIRGTVRALEASHVLIGRIARSSYQNGGLGELAVVLQAESPDEFAARLVLVQNALRSEGNVLGDLAESRADLAAQKSTLAAKRRQVADMKRAQEAVVERVQSLEVQALTAQQAVETIISERADAVAAVEREKQAEEQRYTAMQAESRRLSRILAAAAIRAKQAAARAAARARAAGRTTSAAAGAMTWPVSAGITSSYGMRTHPVTGVYKLHDGTDFRASCGTPVRAAASGVVIQAANVVGYGNQLVINHGAMRGAGVATSYNHLMSVNRGVGSRVDRGDIIAYTGGGEDMYGAGYSTGCHLHFMVYVNGGTTDPMGWL